MDENKSEIAKGIVAALRDCDAKWVSPFTFTRKFEASKILDVLETLDSLIQSGIVERKYVKGYPLYRYTNKRPFLTVVK